MGVLAALPRSVAAQAACEGSLRRLRLERIELYQLHRVDPKVPLEESLGALIELRDEDEIEHIGLSNVWVQRLGSWGRMSSVTVGMPRSA